MLILSRRPGEVICVGDDIKITTLGIKGEQVRLGIDASKETAVHRFEIYEKIRKEKDLKSALTDKDTGLRSIPVKDSNVNYWKGYNDCKKDLKIFIDAAYKGLVDTQILLDVIYEISMKPPSTLRITYRQI